MVKKNNAKNVWVVMGGQFGDEGKGLISAYVNRREKASYSVKGGVGPNAEHGLFIDEQGPYLKVNQLSLGWILNPDTQIRIGRGVAVDPTKLFFEMNKYGLQDRIKIDSLCPIITPEYVRAEIESKRLSESIGSTCSGSGFCHSEHILRTAKLARDFEELRPFLIDVAKEINSTLDTETVVIESSQGYGLSLGSNYYPNVTSKEISSTQALADVGINPFKLKEVLLCIKTMPTREGGGPLGVPELTQEEINDKGLVEISSIGGKIRRKGAEIDFEMLNQAVMENGVTQIALTFCENFDPKVKNIKNKKLITSRLQQLIDKVEDNTNVPVTILNTGKPYDSIVDLSRDESCLNNIRQELDLLKYSK